jgi:uncharacterized membrane protein
MSEVQDAGAPSVTAKQNLAGHVEESVDAVARFREEHVSSTPALQKVIDRITDGVGRPVFLLVLLAAIAAWIGAALAMAGGAVDQPSFAWLELAATLLALLVSVLILVTQRHEDLLAERRAQLVLELALLADRKSAKIIALLEELRRDSPSVSDRVDRESEDMQQPADPMKVLAAIDKRTDNGALSSGSGEMPPRDGSQGKKSRD